MFHQRFTKALWFAVCVLLCTVAQGALPGSLTGVVTDADGNPIRGAMVTAFDEEQSKGVTVSTDASGRYLLAGLEPGDKTVRARLIGFEDARSDVAGNAAGDVNLKLERATGAELERQRRGFERISLLDWASEEQRLDFVMRCAYCHQIGTEGFRAPEQPVDWQVMLEKVMAGQVGQGSFRALHKDTQKILTKKLYDTYHRGAEEQWPTFSPPPAPDGEALKAVVTEWQIGPQDNAMIHDLELGDDGLVYVVDMIHDCVRTLDPKTGERVMYRVPGGKTPDTDEFPIQGPHSIEKAANGDMWITLALGGKMAKFDPKSKQFTVIEGGENGRRGGYPHTLRFDQKGICWYTDAALNSVFRLDPATQHIKQYRLLKADQAQNIKTQGETGGITPYGIDIAPDGKVWFGKLNGQRIGVIDPASGEIKEWQPPVHGPRRLHVDAQGIVWIPGFASGDLCRYNPANNEWKNFKLPGDGHEIPYALNIHPQTGDVWICGTGSDTMMRFDPKTEKLVVYRMPSQVTYTREIEFDADGNVWTCNSNYPVRHIEGRRGTIIKISAPGAGIATAAR
jgi:streptogramin lyase